MVNYDKWTDKNLFKMDSASEDQLKEAINLATRREFELALGGFDAVLAKYPEAPEAHYNRVSMRAT